MNLAFNFNPLLAFTAPYSTLGTGVIVLPTKDSKEAIVSFLLLGQRAAPNTSGFGDLNGNDILVVAKRAGSDELFRSHRAPAFWYNFTNKTFHLD